MCALSFYFIYFLADFFGVWAEFAEQYSEAWKNEQRLIARRKFEEAQKVGAAVQIGLRPGLFLSS